MTAGRRRICNMGNDANRLVGNTVVGCGATGGFSVSKLLVDSMGPPGYTAETMRWPWEDWLDVPNRVLPGADHVQSVGWMPVDARRRQAISGIREY